MGRRGADCSEREKVWGGGCSKDPSTVGHEVVEGERTNRAAGRGRVHTSKQMATRGWDKEGLDVLRNERLRGLKGGAGLKRERGGDCSNPREERRKRAKARERRSPAKLLKATSPCTFGEPKRGKRNDADGFLGAAKREAETRGDRERSARGTPHYTGKDSQQNAAQSDVKEEKVIGDGRQGGRLLAS